MGRFLAYLYRRAKKAWCLLLWAPVVLLPASMLLPYENATLGEFHLNVNVTSYFAETIVRTGHFPTALSSELFIGLPNPIFYGPMLFRILGVLGMYLHPGLAVRVAAVALFAAQFYLVRRSLLRAGSSTALAGTVACLTIWALYPLTNLYHRGAHGEFFGVGFLTCAVCFWFDALLAKRVAAVWRRTLAFALCWTLMIGTHAITAMCSMVAFLLLVATLHCHQWSVPFRTRLAALAVGSVLGALALSAWGYAVWSFRKDLNIQRPIAIFETPYDQIWLRLFPVPLDPEHLHNSTSRNIMDMQINLPLVLVAGAAFLVAVRSMRARRRWTRLVWLALPVALGLATLVLSGRADFFLYLPRMAQAVQFPYRLISHCNLFFLLAVFFLLLDARRWGGTRGPSLITASPVVLAIAVTLSGTSLITKLSHAFPIWLPPEHRKWDQPATGTSAIRQRYATEHLTYGPADYTTLCRFPSLRAEGASPVCSAKFRCGSGDQFPSSQPCIVHLLRPGYVLTTVSAFPWNHFLLDGKPVDPESLRWDIDSTSTTRVPSLALPVPSGEHRIETYFRPDLPYRALAVVSDTVLVLWGGGLVGASLVWGLVRVVRRDSRRRLTSSRILRIPQPRRELDHYRRLPLDPVVPIHSPREVTETERAEGFSSPGSSPPPIPAKVGESSGPR